MAVSPADFYAYSRATGVAIPDEPEERARMAPEVLEFRRNQLKAATPTGPDPLSVGLGIGLALAGGGAGVLAAQQALNKQKLSAVGGTRTDLTRVKDFDLSRVPSVQQQAPTTGTVVTDLKPSKEISPRAYAESTGALAPKDDSFLQFSQRAEQFARVTTPQDLTSASAFGRLFFRLGLSKTQPSSIKMVQRCIDIGVLISKDGEIQPGPHFDI